MSVFEKAIGRLSKIKLRKGPDFRNEHRIYNGRAVTAGNQQPSILFATLHKAASVYAWEVLKQATRPLGMKHANFDGYNFFAGRLGEPLDASLFSESGFLYGPFRTGFAHIPSWGSRPPENFRVLIQLRDPRDALTSGYFSFLHSHCVVRKDRKRMKQLREGLESQDIHQYVSHQAKFTRRLLGQYAKLFDAENCCVVHYEDMVCNPTKWTREVLDFLDNDHPKSRKAFDQVAKAATKQPAAESVHSHRRKVTPGDFREKLPADLIAKLNRMFSGHFQALNRIGKLPAQYQVPDSVLSDAAA